MFINIEMDSDIPIYIQLAHELTEKVANGSLKQGASLFRPSARLPQISV